MTHLMHAVGTDTPVFTGGPRKKIGPWATAALGKAGVKCWVLARACVLVFPMSPFCWVRGLEEAQW